jgi:hypothetical protein
MTAETTVESVLISASITCYPLVAPHDEPAPFVVFQEIPSDGTIRTHSGNAAYRSRWQLACWAYSYTEARELAARVRDLFDLNRTDFEIAMVHQNFDLPDPDSGLYRRILEVSTWEKQV